MKRRSTLALCAVALLLALHGAAWAAEPTEDALIAKWEELQASDPRTEVFEKTADGIYRFRTARFPYDGTLRVLNTSIDDLPGGDCTIGVVEVELEGLSDDFMAKHAHSYAMWSQNNMLYFDVEAGEWLAAKDRQKRMLEAYPGVCGLFAWHSLLGCLVPVALIVVLVFVLVRSSRHMKRAFAVQDRALEEQKRALEQSERAIRISEEGNRLLREILDTLRSGGTPGTP